MSTLTILQQSNHDGFPKAAELIEIAEGGHQLEASDRALYNQLLQMAHDSGRLTEADAEWEVSLASLRRASSRHESNDRVRESLDRLMDTKVFICSAERRQESSHSGRPTTAVPLPTTPSSPMIVTADARLRAARHRAT